MKFTFKNFFNSIFKFRNTTLLNYLKQILKSLRYIKFYIFATKTAEQVKARNFEISGWGGFQLSSYTLELEDYYDIGKEIAIFTNPDELIKQCKFYLSNQQLRKEICFNGHKKTGEHMYSNRLKKVLEILKETQVG